MKLLVLAGGFGTRLQSVLPTTPKALAPIGDTPFLALQLENWIAQGVDSFTFLLHHQADQILDFLESMKPGMLKDCEVNSVIEPQALDTGGAVAYAVRTFGLEDEFLVANADTWLGSGVREFAASTGPAIAVVRLADASRYGQVQFDDRHRVTAFSEKKANGGAGWINAGLCRLPVDLFRDWDGQKFSLERQTYPDLVWKGGLQAIELNADFIDIGIPADYQRFCRWIKENRATTLCN